jgi:hypothetical protein
MSSAFAGDSEAGAAAHDCHDLARWLRVGFGEVRAQRVVDLACAERRSRSSPSRGRSRASAGSSSPRNRTTPPASHPRRSQATHPRTTSRRQWPEGQVAEPSPRDSSRARRPGARAHRASRARLQPARRRLESERSQQEECGCRTGARTKCSATGSSPQTLCFSSRSPAQTRTLPQEAIITQVSLDFHA